MRSNKKQLTRRKMKLTKEELKKYGWKSNAQRQRVLKGLAKKMAKYIMDTSPAFKINQ